MDRFRRLPLPALLPILFVLVGGLYFAIGLASNPDGGGLAARAIGSLFSAVLMTVFFGFLIAYRRRRAGGTEGAAAIQRAVRSGDLPADIDHVVWTRELESTRKRYRNNRVIVPIMVVVFAAFSVWAAMTVSPFWWAILALFVGMCAYSVWETRRALRNIEQLLTSLRGTWTVR
ncbi:MULTISPECIES: hypothetical protein [unclassified Curtobacterium]|uniref:hypothetical protein n=1 Tax=unclassified Curtobacterium TaxID=257496 RepID=UPI000F46FE16|nr:MULTISPECIES: hypothetical protein [unclassified Curtobacterium]ROQ07218.1 hypothetical protein EDF41_2482 [Curtobacterium sp. PhB171]ROQ28144.1 hypothetical protein EDF40_1274 [Curtobacterium sp. PhB170]ROS35074.1 hypothetical protein EDF25_2306 [Curtobacterium sp. PhB131]ROS72559.1 hypothetical protein EDF30_0490 [Curtobacterium sp. PhB141]